MFGTRIVILLFLCLHKSIKYRLLPGLTAGNDTLSFEDAVMLSKVDNRLLSPEPESLCKIGVADDSEQNELAEKDRFEDTLISRQVFHLSHILQLSFPPLV